MWYVLAAANALSGDADLIAGTQLKVPEMAASKNDATSFRPYNPGEIVGSTSPGLPYIPPQASSACSYVIMAVVAAVVIVLAPELAPFVGEAFTALGIAATETVINAVAVGLTTFAAHAGATAVGSVMGLATFSWRNSVGQGIAAGLTAGLAGGLGGTTSELAKSFAKAPTMMGAAKVAASAVGGAMTSYAGNSIAGVKGSSFSWKAIAASSVADVVTSTIGNSLDLTPKMVDGVKTTGNFGKDFAYNAIGGVVSLHTRRQFGFDDKVDYGAIAANAFANALGNAVGKGIKQTIADKNVIKNMSPEQRHIYDASKDQGFSKRQSLDYAMDVGGLRTMGNEWFGLGGEEIGPQKIGTPPQKFNNNDHYGDGFDTVYTHDAKGMLRDAGAFGLRTLNQMYGIDDYRIVLTAPKMALDRLNQELGTSILAKELAVLEGGQVLKIYLPIDSQTGDVAGQSGPTGATGVDFGQKSEDEIRALGLSPELTEKILRYAGHKRNKNIPGSGSAVIAYLKANPLTLTRPEASEIDYAVQGEHLRAAIKSWDMHKSDKAPSFVELTAEQQTVLLSRTYHVGIGMPDSKQWKSFYNEALDGNWNNAATILHNFPTKQQWYINRVQNEAKLLGFRK